MAPPRRSGIYVLTDYFPSTGGTATAARAAASELVTRGWRVQVISRRLSRSWPRSEEVDGVLVHRVGQPGHGRTSKLLDLLGTWTMLLRLRRQSGFVQTFMDPDYALMAAAAGMRRRTIVRWATRGDPTRFLGPSLAGRLRLAVLRRCSHVALSPGMAKELRECGIEVDAVIPVPTDSKRFRPSSPEERSQARAELGLGDDVVIVFTGHLEPRKGIDLLLQAFASLVSKGARAQLVVVGGSHGQALDLGPTLREFVREQGLGQKVTFTGVVADVAPWLRAADIFCLPSFREGMSNSIVEAMACGLACVAPISAGGDELLGEGAGVVPPSNSPEDLEVALGALLEDPERRRRLGLAALERSRSQLLPVVVDAYQPLYLAALGLDSEEPHGPG